MLIGFNIGFDELRAISLTLWPIDIGYWPRNEQMQASMPIKQGGMLAKKEFVPSELFEQPFSVLVNPMDLENVFANRFQ
jgi:hypothetical protein